MTGLSTVIRKEYKCFFGSGKSLFFFYAVLSIIWSFALIYAEDDLWLILFSVIVTANFSNTVFIQERVSGALEIFITSGISRDAVLFGKIIFVIAMTSAVGLICTVFAVFWVNSFEILSFDIYDAFLYLSVTFLCSAASAYLSVRMSNPRFLHFINLFMISAISTLYSMASIFLKLHPLILSLALILTFLLMGVIFTFLARLEFSGERITRPIIF